MKATIHIGLAALVSIGMLTVLTAVEPATQSVPRPAPPPSVKVVAEPTSSSGPGIWISKSQLLARPMSGSAWTGLKAAADKPCGTPNLSNQDDPANVCVMAKALVFARTGTSSYREAVVSAIRAVVNSGTYGGRALALGVELGTYPVAADLVDLKAFDPSLDTAFRAKLAELRTTRTIDGPTSLINCHEMRPNNWGTLCGASRAAVAAYLGDTKDLARTAQVLKGWLGERASYAGFTYGDLWWQSNPSSPVGINPKGATIQGHNVDGVLPDDQRRAGPFAWPPPTTNYSYSALQGVVATAIILRGAGYDVFNSSDKAILRAFVWLHDVDGFPAEGDDTWMPHVINYYYNSTLPAPLPARPGKTFGWTDWTHGR